MAAQSHRSDPRILGRRTLRKDHRILADLLRPGLAVLDIGCGTGAITSGIAKAVGPHGRVTGIDRDESNLNLARTEHAAIPNLTFEHGDATTLTFQSEFDVVTSARTLQWIANPAGAIAGMKQATKPGGILVILDYNHVSNQWKPEPPPEFRLFYSAFLAWRQTNQWDNEMANHLPSLFHSAELIDIRSHVQNEIAERGDGDFTERTSLWSEVIDGVGAQIEAAGLCTRTQLQQARETYDAWIKTELITQTLAMRTVIGTAP